MSFPNAAFLIAALLTGAAPVTSVEERTFDQAFNMLAGGTYTAAVLSLIQTRAHREPAPDIIQHVADVVTMAGFTTYALLTRHPAWGIPVKS